MHTYLIFEEHETPTNHGEKEDLVISTNISLDRMDDIDPISYPWIIPELESAKDKIERKIEYLTRKS